MNVSERTQFKILLTKAVDDELSPAEKEAFTQFLRTDPACKKEWQDMKKLKNMTAQFAFKIPPEEQWDAYWHGVYNRLERGFAWIFFSVGAILLAAFGLYHFVVSLFSDAHIPFIVRLGLIFITIGGAALLVSVIREKWVIRKTDPYKEIKR